MQSRFFGIRFFFGMGKCVTDWQGRLSCGRQTASLPVMLFLLGSCQKSGRCLFRVRIASIAYTLLISNRVFSNLFKIDHSPHTGSRYYFRAMMKKEHTRKDVLAVRCPTCGAEPGEQCELSTQQPRTKPHRDRRLIAKD
jgi:hypothetical protein